MSDNTDLTVAQPAQPGTAMATVAPRPIQLQMWESKDGFELAARMAKALCTSTLVPKYYRGEENLGSAMIALDLAQRLGISPLMVMQNMAPIEGKPAWSSKFLIAMLNNSGRFSLLRFEFSQDEKPIDVEWTEYSWNDQAKRSTPTKKIEKGVVNRRCYAWAIDLRTGEKINGPEVSVKMAIQERWYFRNGSKWPTMTDVMLMYRAGSFFNSMYGADLTLGLPTQDEAEDALVATQSIGGVYSVEPVSGSAALAGLANKASAAASAGTAPTAPTEPIHGEIIGSDPEGQGDKPGPADQSWPKELNGTLVDSSGCPFIDSIHSTGKTCNQDGTWRRRKGVAPAYAEGKEAAARTELAEKLKVVTTAPDAADDMGSAADEGPSFAEITAWINEEKDLDQLDSLHSVANDSPLTPDERREIEELIELRREELAPEDGA
jgi:hypothetical protein